MMKEGIEVSTFLCAGRNKNGSCLLSIHDSILHTQVVKYGKGQVKRRILKLIGTGENAKIIWISTTKAKSSSRASISTVRTTSFFHQTQHEE